jgi:hypothetical protein
MNKPSAAEMVYDVKPRQHRHARPVRCHIAEDIAPHQFTAISDRYSADADHIPVGMGDVGPSL